MRKGFLARVFRAIGQADIVLEVVDARFVEETRNLTVERKATEQGKPLLVVINKADLVNAKQLLEQKKALPFASVSISTKSHAGIRLLRGEIGKRAKEKKTRVAVVGYPNTGKSAVINSLAGRHAARVSSKSGFTRGEQFVRIGGNSIFIDSPGVIPFLERDPYKLAILGAKNPEDLDDPELAGIKLLDFLKKRFPEKIGKLGERQETDSEKILQAIAVKWNKLEKKGIPDTQATAKILLKKWQQGKI